MKAILVAAAAELFLFICVSWGLRSNFTQQRARLLLIAYISVLPMLLATYFLTPSDLGFLPPRVVMPIPSVDIAFAVFLYSAGFFGGLLQIYNLADRGFSLRILIDILNSPLQAMSLDDVMQGYSAGHGIAWMYSRRLNDLQSEGLARIEGECLVLTLKGQHLAKLFMRLQEFARLIPSAGDAA